VIQFQLLEVALVRVAQEDREAEKKKEIDGWKKNRDHLKQHQ
jgi:hypothetical protein